MNISEKIIVLRKLNRLSVTQTAKAVNVSEQTVSDWESGILLPDPSEIVRLAKLFSISTDRLLKEDFYLPVAEMKNGRVVTEMEAKDYLSVMKENAEKISIAVLLFILSPTVLLLLSGVSEVFQTIGENTVVGVGVSFILLLAAIGVYICIMFGMKTSSYEFLEHDVFTLEDGLFVTIEAEKNAFLPQFRKAISTGVILCIVSVIPMMISLIFAESTRYGDFYMLCAVVLLLIICAFGVHMVIKGAIINGAYQKLLQQGDYTVDSKNLNRRYSAFSSAYWCLVTAGYLLYSFYTENWSRSWIVWAVAGVLFGAIMTCLRAKNNKE